MSVGLSDESFNISLFLDAGPAVPAVAQAINMFHGIVQVLQEAKEKADSFADSTAKFRDSLRDIRAISGGAGVSTDFLKEQLNVMRVTGLSGTESHDFMESFLGEAEAYKGKMSDDQFKYLQELGGRFAVARGGAVRPRGTLFGRVLAMSPQGVGAEEVLGESAEIARLLSLGSGKEDLLTNAFLATSPSMVAEGGKGAMGSLRNLAVLTMGASRLGSERTTKTTISQFGRVAQGFASPEWQTFLRDELGVKEGTKIEEAMIPIFERMSSESGIKIPVLKGGKEEIAAQVQAAADGETKAGQELNALLDRWGIHQVELRRSTIGMFMQSGVMVQELKKLGPQPVMTPSSAMAQMIAAENDPKLREGIARRRTDARVEAAELETGLRFEVRRRLEREAYGQLLIEGKLGPEQQAATAMQDFLTKGFGYSEQTRLIGQRSWELAEKEFGQKMQRPEPGWAAGTVSDVATLMPRLAAMGISLVAPRTGARMAENVQGAGNLIRETIGGARSDLTGFDLDMRIKEAQDARENRDISQAYVFGPSGKRTYGEYEDILGSQGEKGRKILEKLAREAHNNMNRPLVYPTTARPPGR